jgi:uncharacterized protein YbaR (Trm112 family)
MNYQDLKNALFCHPERSEGSQALKPTRFFAGLRMTNEGGEGFATARYITPPNFGGLMPISKELLEILACPKCKGDIRLNEKGDGLICDQCRLIYEIKDDIPIMLIDEAKPLK